MPQQPRLPFWFLIANFGLIGTAFFAGAMLTRLRHDSLPQPQSAALQVIYDEILKSHVEQQEGHDLLDRAIGGMVDNLDDYSHYVPPSLVAQYEESTTGRYEGVGLLMTQHGDDIVVHFPFLGGPAEQAGMLPGDRLMAVDGKRIAELPRESRNSQCSELVRGPADSTVELRVERGGKELDLRVRRASVQRPTVKWSNYVDPEHGLAYVYLTDFHHNLVAELEEALRKLQVERELRGLVIDLRWNGGGSLDECVTLARRFQPTGVIVSTRRRGAEIERVDADAAQCKFPNLPLVVLVNGESASASEVFAGCLQDHGRAGIVGERTFGKGVVNTVYSWRDFKLKLTTAYYYTPKGRNLGGSHRSRNHDTAAADAPGIAPDVEAPATKEEARAIYGVLAAYEVPEPYREAFAEVARRYDVPVPHPPRPADDPQLKKAVETLLQRAAPGNGK